MNEVAGNFTPEEEVPSKQISCTELTELAVRFPILQDDEELSDLFHSEKAIQVLPGKRAFEARPLHVPDGALNVCILHTKVSPAPSNLWRGQHDGWVSEKPRLHVSAAQALVRRAAMPTQPTLISKASKGSMSFVASLASPVLSNHVARVSIVCIASAAGATMQQTQAQNKLGLPES